MRSPSRRIAEAVGAAADYEEALEQSIIAQSTTKKRPACEDTQVATVKQVLRGKRPPPPKKYKMQQVSMRTREKRRPDPLVTKPLHLGLKVYSLRFIYVMRHIPIAAMSRYLSDRDIRNLACCSYAHAKLSRTWLPMPDIYIPIYVDLANVDYSLAYTSMVVRRTKLDIKMADDDQVNHLLASLPTSLKHLSIELPSVFLRGLPEFSLIRAELETLTITLKDRVRISSSLRDPDCEPLSVSTDSYSVFSRLPPTLRTLIVRAPDQWTELRVSMAGLPESLRRIEMCKVLQNRDAFTALPRNLEHLAMTGRVSPRNLPDTLQHIEFIDHSTAPRTYDMPAKAQRDLTTVTIRSVTQDLAALKFPAQTKHINVSCQDVRGELNLMQCESLCSVAIKFTNIHPGTKVTTSSVLQVDNNFFDQAAGILEMTFCASEDADVTVVPTDSLVDAMNLRMASAIEVTSSIETIAAAPLLDLTLDLADLIIECGSDALTPSPSILPPLDFELPEIAFTDAIFDITPSCASMAFGLSVDPDLSAYLDSIFGQQVALTL